MSLTKRRIVYLAPSIGLTINQSGGAGTHMRGTIKGFEENNCIVLPLIGGDEINTPNAIHQTFEGMKLKDGKTAFNFIKSLLPDKIRLLLRDLRTTRHDAQFEKKVLAKIESFKPDAIYERSGFLSMAGYNISKKLKIPLFLETDGCMVEIISDDYGVFSKSWGNKLERKKLKAANYVVVMNKLAVSIVAKKFKIGQEKFLVKTLGIDVSENAGMTPATIDLIDKYNLNGKFIVGFIGAISTYHGVDFLIDAARYLKGLNDDISIVIVGWSKEAEKLQEIAIRENLNNLIFTGKVDKSLVGNYYSMFNVGVIPDAEEGIYPIKALEYGNFGLCPLVPEYDVFREIISEGNNGYYFKPKNSSSIGEKLILMEKNRREAEQCGNNWKKFVQSNFLWKDTVREIIKELDRIIGNK